MGYEWDGEINYPDNFALRNVDSELDQMLKMKQLSTMPELQLAIDARLAETLDIEIAEQRLGVEVAEGEAPVDFVAHYMVNDAGEQIYIETPTEHEQALINGYVELN